MLEVFNYKGPEFDINTHYLYLYSVLFIFFGISLSPKKYHRILMIFAFIYLWVLASFKDGVGADFEPYYYIFNHAKIGEYNSAISNIEKGFYYLNAIFNNICDYEYFGFMIFHFIILLFVYKSIVYFKSNISIAYALLAYLVFWYFISFNLLRISLAVAIIGYAIRFLIEKKYKTYLVIVISMYFIHRSSMLMVFPAILYIIYQKNPQIAILASLLLFVIVNVSISVLTQFITVDRYASYIASDVNTSIGANIFLKYIPLAYWLWIGKKYVSDHIWHLCFVFTLFACLVDFSGYRIEMLGRLRLYAVVPFMYYIPLFISKIQNTNTVHKYIQPVAAFVYFMLQYYLMLQSYYWGDEIMPYKSILF